MSKALSVFSPRRVARFAFAGMAAALLAGCADSSRFLGNPLGNPFHSASNSAPPSSYDMAPPPYHPPRAAIASRALPPPDDMPSRRVAGYASPAHQSPRLAQHYRAPRTEQTGSIAPASGHGSWTSDGGMAVIAANGESARIIAERYNIPTDALLRTNGFSSAASIHPGTRVIIPVYNANGGVSRVADERPAREQKQHQINEHASRKRLLAGNEEHAGDGSYAREKAKLEREKKAQAEARADADRMHERDRETAKLDRAKKAKVEARAQSDATRERQKTLAKLEMARKDKAEARAQSDATRERQKTLAKLERARKDKAEARVQSDATRERQKTLAKLERARKDKAEARAEADKTARGHDRAMSKLERVKTEKAKALAEAKATRKLDMAKTAGDRRKEAKLERAEVLREQQAKVAKVETVREKPMKVARAEEASRKSAPIDPTPTASLPPASEKISPNGHPEFRWPAHGRIIQGFKSGGNDGINIAVPEGTSVKAAESGVVAYAGNEIKGFGNLVLIRHPNGYVTAYANNSDIEVHRGEQVKRGQTIAKSGQSGNVASPQLHFELRKGSTPVDPTRFLAGA